MHLSTDSQPMTNAVKSIAEPAGCRSDWGDALIAAVAAVLIFARLGHYPFWGDEADTVIFGRSAWETGDMRGFYEGNLYAYRNGAPLEHLKNRAAPPLPYYLVAAFWGLVGESRFWLRFPFAALGLATIALMQHVWRRLGFAPAQRRLFGLTLACNVSFVLYSRQCRYYALTMFLSLLISYLYASYEGSKKRLAGIVLAASLLAATQFISFAAVMAALLVDYAGWHRRRKSLSLREWTALIVPTAIVFGLLLYRYFPWGRDLYVVPPNRNFLLDRWTLLLWSLRDLNLCEYGVGLALAAALPLGFFLGVRRGEWLMLRIVVGSFVMLLVTTILSPQPVAYASQADVRYFMPLIVPGVSLTVMVCLWATQGRLRWAVPLLAVCTFSNVLHKPIHPLEWRSSFASYLEELAYPRRPASEVLCDWLKTEVAPGTTVALTPSEWIAPALIHAPHLFYGWQIELEKTKRADDYRELDERLFPFRKPVDAIIVLGAFTDTRDWFENRMIPMLAEHGYFYERWTALDTFYDDRTRPELFWHWFREQAYDKENNAIYIYRRIAAAPAP